MLFDNTKIKVRRAFRNVKKDMSNLRQDHSNLKRSTNEWIIYLERNQKLLEQRMGYLERLLELKR